MRAVKRVIAKRQALAERKASGVYCPQCGEPFRRQSKHPTEANKFIVVCRRNHVRVKSYVGEVEE